MFALYRVNRRRPIAQLQAHFFRRTNLEYQAREHRPLRVKSVDRKSFYRKTEKFSHLKKEIIGTKWGDNMLLYNLIFLLTIIRSK